MLASETILFLYIYTRNKNYDDFSIQTEFFVTRHTFMRRRFKRLRFKQQSAERRKKRADERIGNDANKRTIKRQSARAR
jgi:hypothetical protein